MRAVWHQRRGGSARPEPEQAIGCRPPPQPGRSQRRPSRLCSKTEAAAAASRARGRPLPGAGCQRPPRGRAARRPRPRRSRLPLPPADNRGPSGASPAAQRGLGPGSQPLSRRQLPLVAAAARVRMARQPRGFLQEASHQVVAGGSAGLVEICLMHPLDVVKTRFQIQRGKTDPTSYKSLGDCFRTIFQREGFLGFYKGILPPVLAETPKRAVKFFTFEQYKKLLGYASLPPGLAFAVAGLGSGLTEAVVVNPFEVVKVTLQTNQNAFTEQPSSFVQAQQIIKTGGLGFQGLNKGLTATLGRHGVFNMVYFGFYFNVKSILPVNKDPNLEFLRKFGIGLVSGTIASIINIPFDVAKSRIQGPQPVPGEIKYRTCFKTMATVYKEEGFLALYKGLLPKIMRLGPGGAVMLLVYEYVYAWLQDTVNHKEHF
ncbi:mitochondrial 2-oxodicarboxylate carrier isoform X1 [Pyrgilauda ruficollis]|uniref:mitochondrial 2-oxodicarboxylate carrier isoform X1 n=2 Tax=Pyrgilauda ruficollis TaxID=221976 RepID=UPI001B88239D|nr:mitochondrial 2-oxodicarboxylate carrier isoform X1 [Pyrgilauda ruficollis]